MIKTKKPGLRTKPYPFQAGAVRKAQVKFGGRALLGMDMGLGKSLCALLWRRDHYRLNRPTVVVCPASVKFVWEEEARKHLGQRVQILSGMTPDLSTLRPSKDAIYVVNYDVLGSPVPGENTWVNFLRGQRPGLVVIDESQYIKSYKTKRTHAVRALCQRAPHVLALSGTPLELYPADLFPTLNILRPDKFSSFWSYGFDFCRPKMEFGRWTFRGVSNPDKLHALLTETCLVRVLKKDVLKDLPKRVQSVVPVEISRPREYKEAEADLIAWLWKKSKQKAIRAMAAERMLRMNYLKHLVGELKVEAVADWIRTFLESTDEKIILFGIHKDTVLHRLHAAFKGVSTLVTGSVTGRERFARFARFNKDASCRLLFGNLQAAGAGWSCTSTSKVGLVEFPWNPALVKQARDRVHGIGRGVDGKRSQTFWFVAKGTVDEHLCRVIQSRSEISDQVMDGKVGRTDLNVMDLVTKTLMKERFG